MLEREASLGLFEEARRDVYDMGYRLGSLQSMVSICRNFRDKADTASLLTFYHFFFLGLSPEGDPEEGADLLDFLERYGRQDMEEIAINSKQSYRIAKCLEHYSPSR